MRPIILCLILLLFILVPHDSYVQTLEAGKKISTGYAKIIYEDEETLRQFNKKIKLDSTNYLFKRTAERDISVESQVAQKIDIIVEKVKGILGMHPKNFKVEVYILKSIDKVRSSYKRKYGREVEFIAFYSPIDKSIYLAADDVKLKVLAHELAHAVIDQYFDVVAPEKIHEILAHYVDENFE